MLLNQSHGHATVSDTVPYSPALAQSLFVGLPMLRQTLGDLGGSLALLLMPSMKCQRLESWLQRNCTALSQVVSSIQVE